MHPMASDGVAMYAKELISLGLLYSELNDSKREGDGDRVLLCCKFFCQYSEWIESL